MYNENILLKYSIIISLTCRKIYEMSLKYKNYKLTSYTMNYKVYSDTNIIYFLNFK
jgi:hypothetical protein